MSDSRSLALKILGQVYKGQKSSSAIDEILEKNSSLSTQGRAFISELVYGTLRWQGKIDFVIAKFSKDNSISKISTLVLDVLRLGVYQLLFMDKVSVHAAVNETVQLVKKSHEHRATGFVNAILREVDRKREEISKWFNLEKLTEPKDIACALSHPQWLVEKWLKEFGLEKTLEICEANNAIAPLVIRVNSLKSSREKFLNILKKESPNLEVEPSAFLPQALRLYKAGSVRYLPRFKEGYFQVQDEASQLVALALDPKPNEHILDACAAPGGKATHCAELMQDQGEVVALDRDEKKVDIIRKNCERLQLKSVRPLHKDLLQFKSNILFDRVLVDAPCSALGVLRRRPEAKWTKTLKQIQDLSQLQLVLLMKAASFLKPQGVLVYSVCTYTQEETQDVIKAFLEKNPNFKVDSLKTILPAKEGMDGHFIARLYAYGK